MISCDEKIMNKHLIHRVVPLLGSFGLILLMLSPASGQVNLPPDAGFREDRILVKPKPARDLAPLHRLLGIQVLRTYPEMGNLQVLLLPVGTTAAGTIATYQASGLVEYAEPDL